MPSNTTLHRQRTLGGLVGIVVLAFGLGYHFFPRLFHAGPGEVVRRNVPALPAAAPGASEASANRAFVPPMSPTSPSGSATPSATEPSPARGREPDQGRSNRACAAAAAR